MYGLFQIVCVLGTIYIIQMQGNLKLFFFKKIHFLINLKTNFLKQIVFKQNKTQISLKIIKNTFYFNNNNIFLNKYL